MTRRDLLVLSLGALTGWIAAVLGHVAAHRVMGACPADTPARHDGRFPLGRFRAARGDA